MKNIILNITLLLLFATVPTACTYNNGHIGAWYGQWKIEAIDYDSQPVTNYEQQLFISFQSSLIKINNVPKSEIFEGEYYGYYCMGEWQESGNSLITNFNGDQHPEWVDWLYLPANTWQSTIVTLNSSKMTLRYTGTNGKEITLHLIKW